MNVLGNGLHVLLTTCDLPAACQEAVKLEVRTGRTTVCLPCSYGLPQLTDFGDLKKQQWVK